MAASERLALLKTDLGFFGTLPEQLVSYLDTLLSVAEDMIRREGVRLNTTIEDDALVAAYAAWLYRKRASETEMPLSRMLRWQLNVRLVGQKMEDSGDDI